MTSEYAARCGISCGKCKFRVPMNCPGCIQAEGKLFWGECDLAKCCNSRKHEHCGKCGDFPCATLNEFAYDPEHGDNGKRIRNLEAWNAE